jgi:hypothetical protein
MSSMIEPQDLSFGPHYVTGTPRNRVRAARARRRQVRRSLQTHLEDLNVPSDDRQTRPGSHHGARR